LNKKDSSREGSVDSHNSKEGKQFKHKSSKAEGLAMMLRILRLPENQRT
jgi:hypothetical protein